MITVSAYLSASIRGKFGDDVPQDIIKQNLHAAKKVGKKLRGYFGHILDLYVPHDQDDAIQYLWKNKLITTDQVLDADCDILNNKDILLVWTKDGYISAGMQVEIDHALRNHIPIIYFERFDEKSAIEIFKQIAKIYQERSIEQKNC